MCDNMSKAYCMKCKEKVDIKEEVKTKTKNGRGLIKGICSKCKGKVAVITK